MPKSSMKDRICATDGMILRPPDAPIATAPMRGEILNVLPSCSASSMPCPAW